MNNEIPQLRIRTEFSFHKNAYGPIKRIGAAIKEIGSPAAGIVDAGTWGHVRFAKEAAKTGFRPLFGTQLTFSLEDGRKPVAWALAADTRGFYRFSSAARADGADLFALFAENASSLVRFAGTALDNPDMFDYIDLNPGSSVANRRAMRLAERTGKPIVLTSDNVYPRPEDYGAFMAVCAQERPTKQYILSLAEMREEFSFLTDEQFACAVTNTFEAAERCANELPKAPIIHVDGDLRALAEAGRDKRLALGHLKGWPQEYADRFERELKMIFEKKFESYFIVVSDLIAWAKERMLVGPGRGSSAGSLICYCLGITEVDPMPHRLLFERFIDVTRSDLPDIDIDFNDAKRDLVFDYLAEKYGRNNVARIGNVLTLKPKSALAEVCKRLGIPDHDRFNFTNALLEYSSGDARFGHALEDTLTQTDVGREFSAKYPEASLIGDVENHASHTGVHAAGVIVCNVPVTEFCTVGANGVAQLDKPDSEYLNLLKIDALGLRTLGIIEEAGVVSAEELYSLKLDDPEVLRIFDEKKFCGIFQFEGAAQRSVSAQIKADSFRTLDHVTALARPGPLGGGAAQKYIERKAGREEVTYRHPALIPVLSDTYGVVLYQEQVMTISRDIGNFPWAVVSEIRKAMSGSKGREYFDRRGAEFIEGAARLGMSAEEAQTIWEEICTFGAWGMNRSHTCAYAVISYWCAWLKRYFPIEFAASSLRRAKDDEQTLAILREVAQEGIEYIAFDRELSEIDWSVKDGKLVGGFKNLVGFGEVKARTAVEQRNKNGFTPKMIETLDKATVKFADLYPIQTAFGNIYRDPMSVGCRVGSRVSFVETMPEKGDVLLIGRVVKKRVGDLNESVRIKKRNGKVLKGPTGFVDLFLCDDTGGPVTCRIDRYDFEKFGKKAAESLVENQDVVMIRGDRIEGFNMIKINRIRCLTNSELILQ